MSSLSSIRYPYSVHNLSKHALNKDVYKDCFFCAFPSYNNYFKLKNNVYSYVDAFFYSYYEFGVLRNGVIVLSNIPYTSWNAKKVYEHQIKDIRAVLYNVNERIALNDCKVSNMNYEVCQMISIKCTIRFTKHMYNTCYGIQLYDDNDFPLLLKAIPVRHCENRLVTERMINNKQMVMIQRKEIAICGFIFQKNLLFLIDWIEYHLMIGVDHIYVYIHIGVNTIYYDTTIFHLLDSYVLEKSITLIIWDSDGKRGDEWSPKVGEQRSALNDCMYRFGYLYKHLTFIDDDEYIVPVKNHKNIKEILNTQDPNDREVFNFFLKPYIYSNRRITKNSNDILINIYPELDEIIGHYRKSILRYPELCEHFDNHNCALQSNGREKPIYNTIMKFFDDKVDVYGWKFYDHEQEMYIAHFYYKKYHYINPVVDKSEICYHPLSQIGKYSKELSELVRERKRKIDYDSFNVGKEYENLENIDPNLFDPRKYDDYKYAHFSYHWKGIERKCIY